jgi:Asp-tRNA(Asn)/Glu-tRNA(Gln) amidotransferase A subunit family amidase
MLAALDQAQAILAAAGMPCVELALPADLSRLRQAHRRLMAFEAAAVHAASLASHPDHYPPRIRALVEEGLAIPAELALADRQARHTTRQALLADFDQVDAWITPAAPGAAPGPETTGDPIMNSVWSYTGLPTITLPIALDPHGLPLGLQLVGPPRAEDSLLAIARRCETALRDARQAGTLDTAHA